jgi:hypothetical protein
MASANPLRTVLKLVRTISEPNGQQMNSCDIIRGGKKLLARRLISQVQDAGRLVGDVMRRVR